MSRAGPGRLAYTGPSEQASKFEQISMRERQVPRGDVGGEAGDLHVRRVGERHGGGDGDAAEDHRQ